ncbi:MAG TPA: SH3 domain-containing protein [Xanthomonadales bacterium]|nr:SH3 domain-containing protein [Xanthomonadales bacterium]
MRIKRSLVLTATFILACGLALPASPAEFKQGGKAWSKHHETSLLAEPGPLAPVVSTVGFAEKLKVREIQGAWLRVKSDEGEGWVFQGNLASEKPSLAPGAGFTTVDAARTDTVAAARPLAPAAQGYAERHGATDAQADIDWTDAEASKLTPQDMVAYMSSEQKGEYQP